MHIGHEFRTSYNMSDNGVDKLLKDVSEEDLGVFVTSEYDRTSSPLPSVSRQQIKRSRF